MNKTLLTWALLGIPVIFLAGSGMHFMFELLGSDGNPIPTDSKRLPGQSLGKLKRFV